MDSEVPRHLGISKAILENVIFCHQEDSNWPLSEPAGLKKKFDEIFEATKYTKALDNIKSIKKEAAIELKVDKEKYSSLVIDKNRAEKLQSSIDKIIAGITVKEQRQQELEDDIRRLTEEHKQFYEGALRHREILNEHSTITNQKDNKMKIIQDLLEHIDEIKDVTESELIERRDQSRRNFSSHAHRLAEAKKQLASTEEELARSRRRHQNKFTQLGQLKAQTQSKVNVLEERQDVIASICSKHGIAGFERIEETRVVEFLNVLRDSQKRAVAKLERIKRGGKKLEEEKQAEIFELKSDVASKRQQKQAISNRVDDIRSKSRNVVHQIEGIKVSEADIKILHDTLKTRRESLSDIKQELLTADHDREVRVKQEDIGKLEASRDELHAELMTLNRQSDKRAKLALKRTDVEKKKQVITALIEAHGTSFRQLVGAEMTPGAAEQELVGVIQLTDRQLMEATVCRDSVAMEKQTINTRLSLNQDKLATVKLELKNLEEQISAATEGSAVAQCITETEDGIQQLTRELDEMTFASTFFKHLLDNAKKTKQCGACQRAFHDESEMARFDRFCVQKMERAPAKKAAKEAELLDWKAQLDNLKELLPLEVSLTTLREVDVPTLEREVKELEAKLSYCDQELEKAQGEVAKLQDRQSDLGLHKSYAADICRMSREIAELAREIESLETELLSSGTTRTADNVQEELDDLGLNLSETKRELEGLIIDREQKRTMMHNLEAQIHQSELDFNVKQLQIKERQSFVEQKDELRREITDLQQQMKAIEEELGTFTAPLAKKEDELSKIRTENAAKENVEVQQVQIYNESLNRLETINKELQKLNEMNIDSNYRQCQQEIDTLDNSIKVATQRMTELQESLSDLDKEASKAKAFERNVGDNIRLRAYQREIQELDLKLAELDIDSATKASKEYDESYHTARKYLTGLQAEQAKLGGEIGIDKKNLKDKRSEMDSEFKDITERYRSQLVKVKTVELANQDLDKYAKALDQAIMKYHSHKMAEINDTIQTLWQKTYQGTDIDNISIKSENENLKSNRSYNYRVVMMKDQVEMDMRGRCSAGQKVLASIIIRLALAESFGTNCGILALDEPTTNLDKENINALAASLAEIIKERRDQSNFQLVVITHDEDFLNQLGQSDVLDKYWRVSRNLQQKSIIERQRLI